MNLKYKGLLRKFFIPLRSNISNKIAVHLWYTKKKKRYFHTPLLFLYHSIIQSNSTFRLTPIPSASFFNVSIEGFAHPRSILLMSA